MDKWSKKEFLKINYLFFINFINDREKKHYDDKWNKVIFPQLPKKLYKYQKNSDKYLNSLFQKQVWFASPKNWDDTNDITVRYDLEQFIKSIKSNYASFSVDLAKRIIDEEYSNYCNIDDDNYLLISNIYRKYINLDLTCNIPLLKAELRKHFNDSEINIIISLVKKIMKLVKNHKFKHEYEKGLKSLFNINEVRNSIYCYCVTESYDNVDMWRDYADDGNGYCIEYNFESANANDEILKYLFPMFYGDKELINFFDIYSNLIKIQIGKGKIKDLFDDEMWKLVFSMFTKSIEYEKENEWRFIISNKECKDGKLVNFDYISAIYLGDKVDLLTEEKIIKFANDNSITIYKRIAYDNTNYSYKKII